MIPMADAPMQGSAVHVRAFREARGWTQERAAKWYGCTPRSWQRYESGERRVPGPLLKKMADAKPPRRKR